MFELSTYVQSLSNSIISY